MTKDELTNLCFKAFPHGNQINELETSSEDNAIRFTWRGSRFRITTSLHVETVQGGCLHGCNESILVRQMLKQYK